MVFVKKMVCEGFKSFRRKTIINFDKGFTGIVGANGSGKSNIIDAFVFVLGELSAKTLRANNIKDLISNGGNGLSQSETASVEIIFDNADKVLPIDAPELSVLRKIDREGNGIYKLNGKKSTRKEVMEMLDLAGMLPNSSNMIMQGELFRLITMNVTERRQLIEDIAGIASYNDKRSSADQELTKVQTNLGQITLLLNEVKTQLDQLEKEKNDALTYLEFVNQEKMHKNALYLLRIKNTKNSLAQMVADRILAEKEIARIHELEEKTRQTIDGFQIKLSDLNLKIRAVEDSELAQLMGTITKLKDHITEIKSSLKYGKKNLVETESEITSLKERLNALDGKEIQLNHEIGQLKLRKDNLIKDVQNKSDEITQTEIKLSEIDAKFIKVKESAKELTAQINNVKEQKNRKDTEITVIENQLGSLQGQKQRITQKIGQNQKELDQLHQELSKLHDEYDLAVERAGGEEFAKDNIERMIKTCEQKIITLQQDQKSLNAESKQKHADLIELQSKIKVYKQMNSGNAAVEAILKLKRNSQIPGIFGTIAELGSADSMYATALEMAAGGKFNWIVVDHQFTAEKCIQYLKENSIGRATFIPLSAVQVSSNDYPIPDNPKIYGKAIDLITFDPLVKKAFEFVFGRCVIVEDIRTANELRLPVKRVTMDGDVVESSNIMTGGQRSRPTGQGFKTSEASEISVLEDAYARIQSRIESNDMEIKSLQNKISELYRKKISGDKESQKVKEKITVCQAKCDRLQSEIHKYEQEILEIQTSAENFSQQKENLCSENQLIQTQLNSLLDQETTLQSQMESSEESNLKKHLRALEDELKRMNKECNGVEIDLTKKSTMLSETILNKRIEFKQQISEKETFCLKSKASLEDSTQILQEEEIQLQTLESKLAQKNAVLSQLLEEKKQLVLEISQAKTNIAQMTNELHPLQLKINTIQLKSNDMETKIGEWNCLIMPDIQVPDNEMARSEQEHQSLLDKLTQDKSALGPVNLKAIDKFKEIDTRFHELENKNEQIIQEREAILEFIQALESEKKKVFMNTFNNINKNFGYIFSRLSPGGEAKLELENLEDPFSGGIEMMARPGEKKWCLTQAMSGGEKTLTIIALILGIQMHVPSPYYVLDEIDAALDDVNAALVADLIKELSGRSQFVIITHRDVTMARVDQLLGVSNREGVSNVVNLSIRNVLKELAKTQNSSPPENVSNKSDPTLEIPQ